jgi:hypothetical protein
MRLEILKYAPHDAVGRRHDPVGKDQGAAAPPSAVHDHQYLPGELFLNGSRSADDLARSFHP